MDMTVVDLAPAPELCEGDWVDWLIMICLSGAAASGLSQYEMLTLLGRRFARKLSLRVAAQHKLLLHCTLLHMLTLQFIGGS